MTYSRKISKKTNFTKRSRKGGAFGRPFVRRAQLQTDAKNLAQEKRINVYIHITNKISELLSIPTNNINLLNYENCDMEKTNKSFTQGDYIYGI